MESGNPFNYYVKAIKNYVTFSGRATRPEYWYFFLFNIIVGIIVGGVGTFLGTDLLKDLYTLFIFLPCLAVGVRRLHDSDRSGWWILLPVVNIIFLCLEGTAGENRFGPPSN